MAIDYTKLRPQKLAYFDMPMTFQSVGATTIQYIKTGSSTYARSVYYKKTTDSTWSLLDNNTISLSDGQKVQLSGNSNASFSYNWDNKNRFSYGGTGKLLLYGNISSLFDPSTVTSATQIKISDFMNFYNSGNSILQDASNFILPNPPQDGGYSGSFGYNTGLSATPALFAQSIPSNGCPHMYNYSSNVKKAGPIFATTLGSNALTELYLNCSNLSCIEVAFTSWGYCNNWVNGVQTNGGIFIKPESLAISRGSNYIPNNWTVLNRVDGVLYNTDSSGASTTKYEDEDPYSDFYLPPVPEFEDGVVFTNIDQTPASVTLSKVGNALPNTFYQNGYQYQLNSAITVQPGQSVSFSGTTRFLSKDINNYYHFETEGGKLSISGVLNTLTNNTDVRMYEYNNLFEGNTNIVDASGLVMPSSIADWCYTNMFLGCTSLTAAPSALPASNLANWCYANMFAGCSSLVAAPRIDSTKSAPHSFYCMFYGCSSLGDAPNLTIQNNNKAFFCNSMFRNCTSLSSISVSFTSLTNSNNSSKGWMYNVASNGYFTKPTTLTSFIRGENGIPTNWTVVDTYPSQIVATNQTFEFNAMQETPAIETLVYTYNGQQTMTFNFDSSLLPSGVYFANGVLTGYGLQMNYNTPTYTSVVPITLSTTELDAAPVTVNATINLVNIPTATITIATISDISWNFEEATTSSVNLLQYITYSGTPANLSTEIVGELPEGIVYQNGILSGNKELMAGNYIGNFDLIASASDARTKTASNIGLDIEGVAKDWSTIPFTFRGQYNKYFTLEKQGNPSNVSLQYSLDNGTTWNSLTIGQQIKIPYGTDGTDGCVMISGNDGVFSQDNNNYYWINNNGISAVEGNVMSLIGINKTTVPQYAFYMLFRGGYNSSLKDASNLVLPATTLSPSCCMNMFNSCDSLLDAPKVLPATTLAEGCYYQMFSYCTKLTGAPQLPATTLARRCYYQMFDGCAALLDAPVLPATQLVGYCYNQMFQNCTSLSSMEVNFTSYGNYIYATTNWVKNVNSNGIFIKPSALPNWKGAEWIPENFTIRDK